MILDYTFSAFTPFQRYYTLGYGQSYNSKYLSVSEIVTLNSKITRSVSLNSKIIRQIDLNSKVTRQVDLNSKIE